MTGLSMGGVIPAQQVADVLAAWTSSPMTLTSFLRSALDRGWRLVPQNARPDLLVIDAGWGFDDDYMITAVVAGTQVAGIAATMPWLQGDTPWDAAQAPNVIISQAASALWGRPSSRSQETLGWQTPAGTFQMQAGHPRLLITWSTVALLSMPEAQRPQLTLYRVDQRRLTDKSLGKLVQLCAHDPLWPQALDRATELLADSAEANWRSTAVGALRILTFAQKVSVTPHDLTAAQVHAALTRRDPAPEQTSHSG